MWEILKSFKQLILSVDPKATRDFGRGNKDYTVWSEYELDGLHGGDRIAEPKWRILVERFTYDQEDPIALALMNALASAENVTFQYSKRRNSDQELLYHAWDCEVSGGQI